MENQSVKQSGMLRGKLFIFALLIMMFVMGVAGAMAADFAVVYNTNSLNLRSEPSESANWLGSYNRGTWIEIRGSSGNWYSVRAPDGKTGYMSMNFLTQGATESVRVGSVKNPKPTQFTNLRQSASYSAKVLGIYYDNTPMLILGENSGWYHVNINGTKGYMRSEFVNTRNSLGSDTVATIVTPNNTGLNLREGPGKDYTSIRQFRGGLYVMVLNKGNNWWRVSIDGYVGFMSTDFLKDGIHHGNGSGGENPGGETPPSGDGYALVKNPGSNQLLNLRESASTSSRVLGQYKNNTRVTVHAQGTEWCYVTVDSVKKTGYMMTKYLDLRNLPSKAYLVVTHPQHTFVNLRNAPSMTGTNVLTRMPDGVAVEVLAPGKDWSKVKYKDYTGYAVMTFLK